MAPADAAARARLADAAAALGVALDAPAVDRLLGHLALLRRWNRVHNLTAVADGDDALAVHLVDCLAAVGPLARRHASERPGATLRIADVGSGGGLPGVVLAACRPHDWQVTCVDAVAKKVAFVRHAAAELRLANLAAVHGRIERVGAPLAADVVVSRAFASLADFAAWSRAALAPGGAWLAMKGKVPDDEIAALPPSIDVFHVEPLTVPGLDAKRCLVWMRPR